MGEIVLGLTGDMHREGREGGGGKGLEAGVSSAPECVHLFCR